MATSQAESRRRRQALAAAAALLLLERRNKAGLLAALKLPLAHLATRSAGTDDLQHALTVAGAVAISKLLAGTQSASATRWGKSLAVQTATATTIDAGRPVRLASKIAANWRKGYEASLPGANSHREAATGALKDISYQVDRIATTETVRAWNDEVVRQNGIAVSRGLVVVETWDAMLDTRTCPACSSLDRTSVTRPAMFVDYPPIHANCRCLITTEVYDREAA